MIIEEAKYKTQLVEQLVCVSNAVYGCDECRQVVDQNSEGGVLDMTIFKQVGDTDKLNFCSWECVLKHLPKVKCDYFVSLPYLFFDAKEGDKNSAHHLIELLKKLDKPN